MDVEPVVELRDITKRFKVAAAQVSPSGTFTALRGVTLSISQGECVVVGGANGSGKTLLMSIAAGLVKPSSGTVKRRQEVGLVFQDADTQILGESAREDVEFSLMNIGAPRAERRTRAESALESVSLLEKADFPARTLSGGEKRRLAAASAAALERQVVILDEPFANLDYDGVRQVVSLIKELGKQGKTLVILTHELEKCLALAGRLVVLHKGGVVFDGTPQEGLSKPLESWGIRNPLRACTRLEDLVWS